MQEQPKPAGINLGDKIPQEHIPLVLNSILNEALLGYTRELVNGEWQWTATGTDGQTTHELHDFVNTDAVAIEMLTRFGDGQEPPIAWQLNRIPHLPGQNERALFQLYLIAPDAKGQPRILLTVNAARIGVAISLALCTHIQANLEMQHRILFPGHYIATAN
jgi:hypothetical protein